jgi:poly [ADP-ribose] polymerase
VPRSRDSASFFGSEELVVYSLAQQRLQYLVAFRVGPSTAASPTAVPDADADGDSSEPLPDSSRLWGLATDVSDEAEPQAPKPTAQTGLLTSSGSKLPLKSHHVRARILDLLAEVSVVQEFQNESAGTHAVCRRGCVGCLGGFRVFCCSLCCAQLAAALYRVCRV